MYNILHFDEINSTNVVNTSDGLRLVPSHNRAEIKDFNSVVTTKYDEATESTLVSMDNNAAIATLWKAVQELKQENDTLKKYINKGDE